MVLLPTKINFRHYFATKEYAPKRVSINGSATKEHVTKKPMTKELAIMCTTNKIMFDPGCQKINSAQVKVHI